jgi:hypothetical protein
MQLKAFLPVVAFTTVSVFAYTPKSFAAVLVQYPFNVDTNPSVLGTDVQSSTLNIGTPAIPSIVGDDGFGNVFEAYPSIGSTSSSTALANDSFFSVSTIANPGKILNLSSLDFSVGKGGNSDPRGYFVRSSVDNFASDLLAENLPTGAFAAPVPKSIALQNNPNFQNLSSVVFRFYNFTPLPTNNSIDYRNLTLNGTSNAAPVPEPFTIIGTIVGGMAALRLKRKLTLIDK